MNDIIIRPKNVAQKMALKQILKKMEIEFEVMEEEKYNLVFVEDAK